MLHPPPDKVLTPSLARSRFLSLTGPLQGTHERNRLAAATRAAKMAATCRLAAATRAAKMAATCGCTDHVDAAHMAASYRAIQDGVVEPIEVLESVKSNSGYHGVYHKVSESKTGKFRADFMHRYIGTYDTAEAAAHQLVVARHNWRCKHHKNQTTGAPLPVAVALPAVETAEQQENQLLITNRTVAWPQPVAHARPVIRPRPPGSKQLSMSDLIAAARRLG